MRNPRRQFRAPGWATQSKTEGCVLCYLTAPRHPVPVLTEASPGAAEGILQRRLQLLRWRLPLGPQGARCDHRSSREGGRGGLDPEERVATRAQRRSLKQCSPTAWGVRCQQLEPPGRASPADTSTPAVDSVGFHLPELRAQPFMLGPPSWGHLSHWQQPPLLAKPHPGKHRSSGPTCPHSPVPHSPAER